MPTLTINSTTTFADLRKQFRKTVGGGLARAGWREETTEPLTTSWPFLREGQLDFDLSMTVAQFQNAFCQEFGTDNIQVCTKNGFILIPADTPLGKAGAFRCTRSVVRKRIIEVLAEETGKSPEKIVPSAKFLGDLDYNILREQLISGVITNWDKRYKSSSAAAAAGRVTRGTVMGTVGHSLVPPLQKVFNIYDIVSSLLPSKLDKESFRDKFYSLSVVMDIQDFLSEYLVLPSWLNPKWEERWEKKAESLTVGMVIKAVLSVYSLHKKLSGRPKSVALNVKRQIGESTQLAPCDIKNREYAFRIGLNTSGAFCRRLSERLNIPYATLEEKIGLHNAIRLRSIKTACWKCKKDVFKENARSLPKRMFNKLLRRS